MSAMEDLSPEVREMLDTIAGDQMQPSRAAELLSTVYGIDVEDMEPEDAESMTEAWQKGEVSRMCGILEDYDVDEDLIQQFREMAQDAVETRQDVDAGPNGESPESSPDAGSGDAPSREEVQQMIRQETPSADEIASELRNQMGAQGGGGQQAAQGGGDGGMNAQQQMVMQLLSSHLSGGGGGQMAELGQQFQKAAMKNYLRKLSKPSLGEIVEMKMYEDMADEYADQYKDEFFGGDPMDELDELESEGDDDDSWFGSLMSP